MFAVYSMRNSKDFANAKRTMPRPARHGRVTECGNGLNVMSQEEFEMKLLEFLKYRGGLVLYVELAQWKKGHLEYGFCSVKMALESLEQKGLIEWNDRGVRAL